MNNDLSNSSKILGDYCVYCKHSRFNCICNTLNMIKIISYKCSIVNDIKINCGLDKTKASKYCYPCKYLSEVKG